MSLGMRVECQHQDLRFERVESPKLSLLPEFLLNLWSQVQQIFYEEDSVERKHVSRIVQ